MGTILERGRRRSLAMTIAAALAIAVVGGASAVGATAEGPVSLPHYDGMLAFPDIHAPSDPEEFSWQVVLAEGWELVQIDDDHAAVVYETGQMGMMIAKGPAHDALGTAVPTSMIVTLPDVVTLVVHHRDGNPAAGGAPFRYPILPGPSFEVGYSRVEVIPGPSSAPTRLPPVAMRLPSTAHVESLVKRRERASSVDCRPLAGGPATSRWRCAVSRGDGDNELVVRAHLYPTASLVVIRAHGRDSDGFVVRWEPPLRFGG